MLYGVVHSRTELYAVVHSRTELYGVVQGPTELYVVVQSPTEMYGIICDRPRENRPSSHLVLIVEIPVLKVLISITSFCWC